MEKTDLRIVKTEQVINETFMEMLDEKPLEKISVTELAKRASINKGTFYLHYSDVYDLYNKTLERYFEDLLDGSNCFDFFFDDPKCFLVRFNDTLRAHSPEFHTLMQGRKEHGMPRMLSSHFKNKVYETGRIAQSVENDIKIDAVLGAVMGLLPRYSETHNEIIQDLFCKMVNAFFKE